MTQLKKSRTLCFRARLAALMAQAGVTQQELAAATGLSQAGVSNYLRGVRSLPRAEELLALAKHFGVSMEWLLGADEASPPGSALTLPADPPADPGEMRQVAEAMQEQVTRLKHLLGDPGTSPRRRRAPSSD